jgi:hypothetical protein
MMVYLSEEQTRVAALLRGIDTLADAAVDEAYEEAEASAMTRACALVSAIWPRASQWKAALELTIDPERIVELPTSPRPGARYVVREHGQLVEEEAPDAT